MAATTLQFDAKRVAQFVVLIDSDNKGEAESALLRLREEMKKSQCRFADALETDGYVDAITKQAKPNFRRSVQTDDRQLNELRAVNERLTAQLASLQADRTAEQARSKDRHDGLLRLHSELREINARLLKKTRGERSWGKKVAMVLLLLCALAVMRTQWGSSGTDGNTSQKLKAIKDRAAQEMGTAAPRRK